MAKNTRELIIKALITLAKKNPQRSSFTMTEIAAEAGISRQAIYQKHFNNFEDIIEYIHEETNQHIFNVFNKYSPSNDGDPISFLADHILPLIYEKREVVNTLYTTQVDPCWKEFLRGTYSEWVLKNVNYQLKYNFNKEDIAYIITTMAISFIEVWIRKDNPIPPEEYRETFIQLSKTSLCCVLKKNLELHSRFFLLLPFKGIDHYLKFFIGKRDSFSHFGMVWAPSANVKLCRGTIKANAI